MFNEGSDHHSLPFTEQDLYALFKKRVISREHLLVGYDGRVPTSAASITIDISRKTLGISDLVISPGRDTAGLNLVDHVLRCARQKGLRRVVAWVRPSESRTADVLGLFVFELRQIRINMSTHVAVPTRAKTNAVTSSIKSDLVSSAPAFEHLLHEGFLSIVDIRDSLSQKWRPCAMCPLSSSSDHALVGYCSRQARQLGWVLVSPPHPDDPTQPAIELHELSTMLESLSSLGVRTVMTEVSADRDTRDVFEKAGFSVNHSLYRLVFDLAYVEE